MKIQKIDNFIKDNSLESLDEISHTKYTDDMLLEMANISQKTTGLDVIIWVQTNNTLNTGKHNQPRIKFQNNTAQNAQIQSGIPMSISQNPEILLKEKDLNKINLDAKQIKNIKQWIIDNYDLLIKYWNEKITTDELIDELKQTNKNQSN